LFYPNSSPNFSFSNKAIWFMDIEVKLKDRIREVPDFPIPGVNFKDISPIFMDPVLMAETVDAMAFPWEEHGITKVIGIESRGFLLGPQIAAKLGVGFVIVRKAGKLPPETTSISYSLEYGNATIEMVRGSVQPGDRVLIHDDLLATGGTARASAQLVERLGATVAGFSFIIDLSFLNGRKVLNDFSPHVHAIVHYTGE
jgi:adenine phosphoribosyltransferase